jgi:hypothetical protein
MFRLPPDPGNPDAQAKGRLSAPARHPPAERVRSPARIGIRLGPDRTHVGQSAEAGSFAKADNKVGGRLFDHHGCELISGC